MMAMIYSSIIYPVMMYPVVSIICFILAIIAVIVLCFYVLPEKKDGKLSPFFQYVHEICNLKKLYIGIILKVLYVLATCIFIFTGIGLIVVSLISPSNGYGGYSFVNFPFFYGLVIMVIGPIIARVSYELLMLFVRLVKNTTEIRKRLEQAQKEQNASENEETLK